MGADTAPACNHTRLAFGSGGFYVMCRDCPQTWVARRIGADADTDIGIGTTTPYTGTLEPPADSADALVQAARWKGMEEAAVIVDQWPFRHPDAAEGRVDTDDVEAAAEIAATIRARRGVRP